jgi:DNA-binding response OmpR family regulator
MVKPFNILELKARVRAILRRVKPQDQQDYMIEYRKLRVNVDNRRVFIDDHEINLTAKEFDLLELLSKAPGKVYSREKLLDMVWGYDYPGDVRTVDVHVRRLREKIEQNPGDPQFILTKWGIGYYFKG